MAHLNKKYDEATGKKYDGPAKEAATSFLEQLGFSDISFNKKEGIDHSAGYWDLEAIYGGEKHIFEAEIKEDKTWTRQWKDNDHKPVPFSWDTVDIPARKEKIIAKLVMVFNVDTDRLIIIDTEEVKRSPISLKRCRNTGEREPFFNVPLPNFYVRFYHKNDDGKWVLARQWDKNKKLVKDIRQSVAC